MNSLPRPPTQPHADNNGVCDCFTKSRSAAQRSSTFLSDVPEFFRCDWFQDKSRNSAAGDCSLSDSTEGDIVKQVDTNERISAPCEKMECHLTVFHSVSLTNVLVKCIEFYMKFVFASYFLGLLAQDPRLYPLLCKYHYLYSGFKIEIIFHSQVDVCSLVNLAFLLHVNLSKLSISFFAKILLAWEDG